MSALYPSAAISAQPQWGTSARLAVQQKQSSFHICPLLPRFRRKWKEPAGLRWPAGSSTGYPAYAIVVYSPEESLLSIPARTLIGSPVQLMKPSASFWS